MNAKEEQLAPAMRSMIREYRNAPSKAARDMIFGKMVKHNQDAFIGKMAPPGAIPGIHPLLESRRFLYGIPNGAFSVQAAFDVCLVHQLPRHQKETYGDGKIIMPQQAKRRVEEESPEGILVGAGLKALDVLRSNGIDLGHYITFIRQAPWRIPCEMVDGVEYYLILLRVGDITGSKDLRAALANNTCKIEYDKESRQHIFVDEQGQPWTPQEPFLPEDY